jgi:DNA-directed RNA polymerase subunit RPC12/RpoP
VKCIVCGRASLENDVGDDLACPRCGSRWRRVA